MAVAISSGWFPQRADVYQHDIIWPSSAPALPEHRESFGYEEIGERTRWWRRAPLVLRGGRLRSHPVRECSVLSSLVGSLEDLESGITYGRQVIQNSFSVRRRDYVVKQWLILYHFDSSSLQINQVN
jgi:hypothetical protein